MGRLSVAIVVTAFTVLLLGVSSDKVVNKRDIVEVHIQSMQTNDVCKWFCDNNPFASLFAICEPYMKTTTTTATTPSKLPSSPPGPNGGNNKPSSTTPMPEPSRTTSATSLERAHWCRFSNGSFIPLAFTFMYSACQLCQCTQSREIRCATLQCMSTYCIDNSVPSRRSGQCCTQCTSDVNSTSCQLSGITFPHGTLIKRTGDNVQCWCQLGTVECRKIGVSLFSGMDLWGQGTAIYIVVIIICVLLIIGTLLCGGCSLIYYYYYYYNQPSAEQADWNNAGWQPMGEEEPVVDGTAENKQAEAAQSPYEQSYPTSHSQEFVPPPYALYNGNYATEQTDKNAKHI